MGTQEALHTCTLSSLEEREEEKEGADSGERKGRLAEEVAGRGGNRAGVAGASRYPREGSGRGGDAQGGGSAGKPRGTQEEFSKCLRSSPEEDPENTGRELPQQDAQGERKEEMRGAHFLAYSGCSEMACFLPQERAAGGEVRDGATGRTEVGSV